MGMGDYSHGSEIGEFYALRRESYRFEDLLVRLVEIVVVFRPHAGFVPPEPFLQSMPGLWGQVLSF